MAEEDMYQEGLEEGYEEEIPLDGGEDYNGEQPAEDLEAMKRKLQEMEVEAARLKAQQAAAAGETSNAAAQAGPDAAAKEEADGRSIYIGNVDYSCTPEELQQHFQQCGTVNRVTILTDKFGNPKGYAYLEFLEVDAVQNALMLDNTELRGRNIKVSQKRTNVPGLKMRGRGRGRGPHMPYGGFGGRGGGFYGAPAPYAGRGRGFPAQGGHGYGGYGGGYGYAPRGRGRGRFFAPY